MDTNLSDLKMRTPEAKDVSLLADMISQSTGGKSKITAEQLHHDLFPSARDHIAIDQIDVDDPSMVFESNLLRNDEPAAHAVLAEFDGQIVGYAAYHYYYSPWHPNHSFWIDDVFVVEKFRLQGIAKRLTMHIQERAIMEKASYMIFSTSRMERSLSEYIGKIDDLIEYRSEVTDWSICRIDLK